MHAFGDAKGGIRHTDDELVNAKLLHGVRGGRLLFGLHTTGKIKVTTYVSTEYEQQERVRRGRTILRAAWVLSLSAVSVSSSVLPSITSATRWRPEGGLGKTV